MRDVIFGMVYADILFSDVSWGLFPLLPVFACMNFSACFLVGLRNTWSWNIFFLFFSFDANSLAHCLILQWEVLGFWISLDSYWLIVIVFLNSCSCLKIINLKPCSLASCLASSPIIIELSSFLAKLQQMKWMKGRGFHREWENRLHRQMQGG